MRDRGGETTLKLRERLAIKAFIKTSDYDRAIAAFLNEKQETETSFSLSLPLVSRLRYGENPHQSAALYGDLRRTISRSCTAKSFPLTTSSTSPRRPI